MVSVFLEHEKRKVATRLSLVIAVGCGAIWVMSLLSIGVAVPSPAVMFGGMVFTAILAYAGYRGKRAHLVLPWFMALFVGLSEVEPGVSHMVDISIVLAPSLGMLLADTRSMLGTTILQIAILAFRCGRWQESPYVEGTFLVVLGCFLYIVTYTHKILNRALSESYQTRMLAGAVSTANEDIVFVREIKADGALGAFSFFSHSVEKLLGFSEAEVVAANFGFDLIHEDERETAMERVTLMLGQAGASTDFEVRLRNHRGQYSWFHGRLTNLKNDPHIGGLVTVFRSIQEERKVRDQYETRLRTLASEDALTSLPNRRVLGERLRERAATPPTIMVCDFDGFKNVNDTLGHEVGDEILKGFATRLGQYTKPGIELFRLGGDEFVFLLDDTSADTARDLAEKIVQASMAPIVLPSHAPIVLTVSVGIAVADRSLSADEQMRGADLAMYAAKDAGRRCYRFFDASMQASVERKHRIEQALRIAIEAGELTLMYQPKLDVKTGRVTGYEALARWPSKTLGSIPPSEFIPVAEERGLIVALGEWVIRTATREVASWNIPDLQVSVNLSPAQIEDSDRLIATLREALGDSGMNPKQLQLEITETVFMRHTDLMLRTLRDLRTLGVSIAVDDFGTGYSSLAFLRKFPVDSLKVDQSFARELDQSIQGRAIFAAIMTLARELSLKTCAEGIETRAEFLVLQRLGCDEVQGYFFSPPLDADKARAFARGGSTDSLFAART